MHVRKFYLAKLQKKSYKIIFYSGYCLNSFSIVRNCMKLNEIQYICGLELYNYGYSCRF